MSREKVGRIAVKELQEKAKQLCSGHGVNVDLEPFPGKPGFIAVLSGEELDQKTVKEISTNLLALSPEILRVVRDITPPKTPRNTSE
jgi:translation initiation factor 2 alpha subunit (eIF-2alpha)